MLEHPNFDPIAFGLGPLQVRWYGLMYLFGFMAGWALGRYRAARLPGWKPQYLDDIVFYIAMGVILGGRIGYVIFYNFDAFLHDPLMLIRIWEGGMAFHGGLLGVLVAMLLYARKMGKTFFQVTDFIAPLIPPGLFFGRIGNFINGELWGRTSDVSWAMIFHTPGAGDLPRHPSQLYQAALEGLALFLIVWFYSAKPRPTMAISGFFLIGYGFFRFTVELAREPDAHLGFIAFNWLTMGQLLSIPMLIFGLILMFFAYHRKEKESV